MYAAMYFKMIYEPFYFFAGFLVIAKYLENGSILV